jgi:hypothetical protein
MMLIGTDKNLIDLDRDATLVDNVAVTAVATNEDASWALLDAQRVVRVGESDVADLAALPRAEGQSLAPLPDGSVMVGLTGARLVRVSEAGMTAVPSFDDVPGRDEWENPANPTPDTRTMAVDADGRIWVNVHVGGVWRSDDGGATWHGVVEPDADVHEITTGDSGRVAVAAAVGFGWSDSGTSWSWTTDGFHESSARAVALEGNTAFVSASTGPFTTQGGVYRADLGSAFVRCEDGLPEWFPGNIDSGCLAAREHRVAIGTREGTVHISDDGGRTWQSAADGLAPIRAVRLA